jgi:hypothetical protein
MASYTLCPFTLKLTLSTHSHARTRAHRKKQNCRTCKSHNLPQNMLANNFLNTLWPIQYIGLTNCIPPVTVAERSKAPHTHTVWPSIRPAQLKTERQNWRVWCSRPVNRLDCWTVGNSSVFTLSVLRTRYFETWRMWLWHAALSACRFICACMGI